MWNKRPDEAAVPPQAPPNRITTPPPLPAAAPPRPAAPGIAAPSSKAAASIGPSMTIKGEIRAQEELFVDGNVEGVLESQSLLTVGPNGKVRAHIKAREVIVYGAVQGNVTVVEKVAIRDHGSVVGDIQAAGISIDDGAYFKGSIDIVRPQPHAVTKPVKTEPPIVAAVGQS